MQELKFIYNLLRPHAPMAMQHFTIEGIESGEARLWLRLHGPLKDAKIIKRQFSGIKDRSGTDLYYDDIYRDTLTNAIFQLKHGFCQILGYTGWYGQGINIERFATISNDNDRELKWNHNIEWLGDPYQNPELLKK